MNEKRTVTVSPSWYDPNRKEEDAYLDEHPLADPYPRQPGVHLSGRFVCISCGAEERGREYLYRADSVVQWPPWLPEGWSWLHACPLCPKHEILIVEKLDEPDQQPANRGLECTDCGSFPARANLLDGCVAGDRCPAGYLDDYDCDGTLVSTDNRPTETTP